MSSVAEMDRYLPGDPSKPLVRKVRRHLRGYGITPTPRVWRLAWEWAAEVAASYGLTLAITGMAPTVVRRRKWPAPLEVGTQYLALLLAEIRADGSVRLPYRAPERIPPAVAAWLGAGPPALPGADVMALTGPGVS